MLRTFIIRVPTAHRVDFVDLTPLLEAKVAEAEIAQGVAHFILKHTSAALAIQEVEPNLMEDFENYLKEFASDDVEEPRFLHNQLWRRMDVPPSESQNADAHIKSLFIGNSRVAPVVGGKLDLGEWQRIILVEMDGPREREVIVMVQGETAMEGLTQYWSEKTQVINAAIEPFLDEQWESKILDASRYMTRGGKRLRGTLTLLTCEALGGDMDKALDAAVAVEMIHAATLAKDDLQDGDTKRRGGLSAWVVYGIRRATALVDVAIPHAISMLRKYGAEAVYVALDAWKEVGVGQVKDLFLGSFRGKKVYDEIIRGKTAALFGLASVLGAIAAGATKEQKKLATRYGHRLGYTFQVIDDLADLEEGKSVPLSFEEWLGEEPARERVRALVDEVREIASEFPESIHRQYLEDLPSSALEAMLAEVQEKEVR